MNIVKASRLQAVLDRARNAGQVEEVARIAGLDLVFSSLVPEAYNAILEELEDVPEKSYALCYQIEHVCRSIVQVDEQSFRGVKFIEVEGEQGGPPVKVELHQWLRDNLVATWSREMLTVAFRKVMDAIKAAEDRAYDGVQFRVADETDEEKYRRVLGELKEAGAELPEDLREAILKEEGLSTGTSKADLQDLESRVRTWTEPEPEPPPPEATPDPRSAPIEPSPAATRPEPVRVPQQLLTAAEAPTAVPTTRTPLNRTPIQEPVPAHPEDGVVMANRRSPAPPPDQVHDLSRTARVAALEDSAAEFVVLERQPPKDAEQTKAILERPPVVGVNPRYVSPHTNASRTGGLNPRRP